MHAMLRCNSMLFSQGERNNDPNDMMRDISSRLSADEKKAVSAYISALH